ncbi:hypothetical protein BDFB_000233, partial [Asbolus verrucosus]
IRLEGHNVPSLCPTDPGTTLAPSSPDMDDGSSKRQATRVFKKSSPNGKITVYLGKRDFVDHIDHVDPIGMWIGKRSIQTCGDV